MVKAKKKLTSNAGKVAEKLNHLHIADENIIKHYHTRKQALKTKILSMQKTYNLPIALLGLSQKNEDLCSHKDMCTTFCSSFVHGSQNGMG